MDKNTKPVTVASTDWHLCKEEWVSIEGFEGFYEVSNYGRIKSLKRFKVKSDRILVHKKNNRGYFLVCLCKKGTESYFLVHRLVAAGFLDNPNDLSTVDHIDNDKNNNHISNLRWMDNLDNWMRSNYRNNGSSKITFKDALKIRHFYSTQKYSQKELCSKFNLSKAQICSIIKNKSWKDE